MYEVILAGFKFGDFPQNRQFAKLKTSPKFPAIWYYVGYEVYSQARVCVNIAIVDT